MVEKLAICKKCKRVIQPEEDIDNGKCNDCARIPDEHFNDIALMTKNKEG